MRTDQKSSTILFLILRMISFRRSISSFATFYSFSFYYIGYVLSWIPSSCSTILCTFCCCWCECSSSSIFLRYSSFFLLIFSRCSNKRFFLSYMLYTLDSFLSGLISVDYCFSCSSTISGFFEGDSKPYYGASFLTGAFNGGRSFNLLLSSIGFSLFLLAILAFS